MAGMSLVSSLPPPSGSKVTASTISSSPPDNHDDDTPLHPGYMINQASAPGSPGYEKKAFLLNTKSQSRPPGLSGAALPSPISKPGHSKDSSATSPQLTLTPNSSVDGTSEWISMVRQASPFHSGDEPSLPFLNTEGRRSQVEDVSANLSTLHLASNDSDSLLGLDALREPANSLPNQLLQSNAHASSSRGHFPSIVSSQQPEYERPRSTRDRPPLSQSYGEVSFLNSERSVGGLNNPFTISSNRSVGEANNMSMESSDSRGFGAIGRPEFRHGAGDYEPNRRRASSQDNLQSPFFHQQQGITDQLSNKFRTLPTLGAHIHQQKRVPESYGDGQKVRHIRSISQPGIPNVSSLNQNFPTGIDAQFYSNQPHSYSDPSSLKSTRSASMTNPLPPQAYDSVDYGNNANSLLIPSISGAYGGYRPYATTHRREAFDYQTRAASQSMLDDMHAFGASSPSLGQNPRQPQYSGHIRQASDSVMMSMGGMNAFHGQGSHFNVHPSLDDDFAHPLAGEDIEVPDHDDPHNDLQETYFITPTSSHPLLRTATHSHSMSLDAIPSQYSDISHHRSLAGSPLPAPKVIYAVKFKRSQRNFVLGPRISRDLKIGTYVKVEADRGEDLGIVVGKVSAEKYGFSARSSFSAGMGPPPSLGTGASDFKRIIRLATHDEVSLLSLKREEEEELLKICRRKVRERCLPMNVVDAEYQFDRHKLTFFFEAEGRVDFRELVRDLFSMYKTRIWMQQLDKNTSTSAQAIISPQAVNLQMDYGTPIIAPPSEFADSIILNGFAGFDSRP